MKLSVYNGHYLKKSTKIYANLEKTLTFRQAI